MIGVTAGISNFDPWWLAQVMHSRCSFFNQWQFSEMPELVVSRNTSIINPPVVTFLLVVQPPDSNAHPVSMSTNSVWPLTIPFQASDLHPHLRWELAILPTNGNTKWMRSLSPDSLADGNIWNIWSNSAAIQEIGYQASKESKRALKPFYWKTMYHDFLNAFLKKRMLALSLLTKNT